MVHDTKVGLSYFKMIPTMNAAKQGSEPRTMQQEIRTMTVVSRDPKP